MKFKKLSLDESLLDDFDGSTIFNTAEKIDWAPAEDIFGKGTDNTIPSAIGYDDDFSAPEYMPDMECHHAQLPHQSFRLEERTVQTHISHHLFE